MKILLTFIILVISINSSACELGIVEKSNIQQFNSWLGNNSSFARSFIEGKCALDKALNKLPISQKKVIANLIAKAYGVEIKNIKKLNSYNY